MGTAALAFLRNNPPTTLPLPSSPSLQSLADAKVTAEAAERHRATAAKRARVAEAGRADAEKRVLRWQGKAEEAEREARAERDRADGLEHRLHAVQQRARALVGASPLPDFTLGPTSGGGGDGAGARPARPAAGGETGPPSPRVKMQRFGGSEGRDEGFEATAAAGVREEEGGTASHVLERLLEGSRKEARALQADRARLRKKVERLEGKLRVATGESYR